MSKMIKKVHEGNERTHQISVSESENAENALERLNGTVRETQIMKVAKILC